jgi:hypothetical protein
MVDFYATVKIHAMDNKVGAVAMLSKVIGSSHSEVQTIILLKNT